MSGKALQLTRYQVLSDDTASTAVNQHHILHLIARIEFHRTGSYLAAQRRVGTQQQLLTRLTLSIESTRNLCTTE